MKILVINAGSSSMKYQLIDMENEQVIAKGNCERIGNGGIIGHKLSDGRKVEYEVAFPTHAEAFAEVLKLLTTGEYKVINDVSEIGAVGHRTVHGGEKFASSVLITAEVMKTIDDLSSLAPLHNPPGLAAIKASQKVFGDKTPMVAVFDTAFHQTMPPKAYMYALPYEFYTDYGVRRYGFHGTSHAHVSERGSELAGSLK
ncbi:MAG: acetate kinase, partial [Oscillospiraceae bacterium]